MSVSVRAKFYCESILTSGYTKDGKPQINTAKVYKFRAVYSNDPKHENKLFWDATPSASLEMTITNPDGQVFEVGHEYYLDFIHTTK